MYNFEWKNDGWDSVGIGNVTISDNGIFLSVSTTVYSEDNSTGWSLGNFDNKEMHRFIY